MDFETIIMFINSTSSKIVVGGGGNRNPITNLGGKNPAAMPTITVKTV